MNSCTRAANHYISLDANAKHDDTGHLHLVGSRVLTLHIPLGLETVKRHVSFGFQCYVQIVSAIATKIMKSIGKDSTLPARQGHVCRNR